MSGKTISNSETKIEALKLQSSAYGVTIPLVFGVTRISGNLLDYLGFAAVPHTETQGGKGGGVKVQNTSYTYKADVMMGLCHGPISEVPRIWRGKKLFEGGWTPTQIQTATEAYTPPATGAMVYTVAHAATWLSITHVLYQGTAEAESGTYTITTTAAQGTQYTVAQGVVTIVDPSLRGQELQITYQWASGTRAQTPMDQLGLTFKPGHVGQAAWAALPAGRDVPYSALAYVAGQGYDLGTGAQVENHMFEVVASMAYHLGSTVPDVDPAIMLRAALTQLQGGAGFPAALLDDWSDWSTYCRAAGILVSPAMTEQASAADIVRTAAQLTNAAPVWSGGRLKLVPLADEAETGNGATYTPNTTPVYALDDESYTPTSDGSSPVRVRLKSAADRKNHWRVEFLNRANQYNVEIAEAKDAADIDANGLRSADIVKAHWLCTPGAARKVAQTLLQRSLYINAEYTVPLPWHYALVEPADLLTLADTTLQMADTPVRVTVVEESEDGDLTVTAEDYPPGTASPATYPTQAGSGYTANYNADPGSVDTPSIFEAPYTLAVTGLEVYAAVRGLTTIWGGCQVWVSLDGTGYKQVGVIYGPSRYGALAAALTSGASSLAVAGLGAAAQLLAGSAADAAALQTLCYLGGAAEEYVAYQGATLTGAGAYTLATLVRGAHGTTAAAHASGAPFVRVDDRIAKSGALDPVLIGSTMYFKFTSFNIWGGGQQNLDAVTAWPYTITGSMAGLQPVPGGKPTLTMLPAIVTLTTDGAGTVQTFANARSTARVTAADGSDETGDWGYTGADTGVVSEFGGAQANELQITGFAPSQIDPEYNKVLVQSHLHPTVSDTGRHAIPATIGTQAAFAATGAVIGTGYIRLSGNDWYSKRVTYGPDTRLVDVTGGSWQMSCWVRVVSGVTYDLPFLGNPGRHISCSVSGGVLTIFGRWHRTSGTQLALAYGSVSHSASAWVHVLFGFDKTTNVLKIYINGTLGSNTYTVTDGVFIDQLSAQDVASAAYWYAGSSNGSNQSFGAGHDMDLAEFRHVVGIAPPSANFTPPSIPFADGASLGSGHVDVTASRSGRPDLTARLDVATIIGPQETVSASLGQSTTYIPADWTGATTGSAAPVSISIKASGVEQSSLWAIRAMPQDGLGMTATVSASVLTVSAMGINQSTGFIWIWCSRSGYPTQLLKCQVIKNLSPKPAQVASIDKTLWVLAGDTAGVVTAYTGATATAAVTEGGTDKTSDYTWSHSASAGLTVTRSGAVITLTAMAAGTDSGTVTLTGVKSNWPAASFTIQVTKTKLLIPDGAVADWGTVSAFSQGQESTNTAAIRLTTTGAIQRSTDGGSTWTQVGQWFSPTTSGAGAGYSVIASGTQVGLTGTLNTMLALSSDRTWSVLSDWSGNQIAQANLNLLVFANSNLALPIGQGRISLYSIQIASGS